MDRDEFMELVYETFADEPDNVFANGIIEAADAYAEHEKAQLSQQGATSDLISRQQTLNALMDAVKSVGVLDADDIKTVFDALPSVQHEKAQLSSEDATKDAISKTETVEHLRRVLEATVPNTDYDEGYIDGIEFGISTVSTMPTIQPQSTTGKLNDGVRSTAQSTDLIDRQQAIDALMAAIDDVGILDGADIKVVFDNLPSAQPEPKWIPVSERLPDDLSEVNVTWINHNPEQYYEFTKDKPFTATAVYYKSEWYWYSATCVDYLEEYGRCDWNKIDEAIEIIAWMPLPEAYKPNK